MPSACYTYTLPGDVVVAIRCRHRHRIKSTDYDHDYELRWRVFSKFRSDYAVRRVGKPALPWLCLRKVRDRKRGNNVTAARVLGVVMFLKLTNFLIIIYPKNFYNGSFCVMHRVLSTIILMMLIIQSTIAAGEPTKPNIVFIMADDLGWKDVGYAGAQFFETPQIDKLAKQSMMFTRGYTSGPNCAPTRGCLVSGTYTPRHKIYQPGGSSKGNIKYMKL